MKLGSVARTFHGSSLEWRRDLRSDTHPCVFPQEPIVPHSQDDWVCGAWRSCVWSHDNEQGEKQPRLQVRLPVTDPGPSSPATFTLSRLWRHFMCYDPVFAGSFLTTRARTMCTIAGNSSPSCRYVSGATGGKQWVFILKCINSSFKVTINKVKQLQP